MVGMTLAFGGVQSLSYSLMEAVILALVLILSWKFSRQEKMTLRIPLAPVLFALLVLLQIIPLPADWVQKISPARQLGSAGLNNLGSNWTTLSVYPHDTVLGLIKFLAYFGAFGLAAYVFDSRKRKSILVSTLI